MADKRKQQVVYVERHSDRSLMWFLLFGWFYLGWRLLKWMWGVITWPVRFGSRTGWDVLVKWPYQATVAACVWTWRGVRRLVTIRVHRPD